LKTERAGIKIESGGKPMVFNKTFHKLIYLKLALVVVASSFFLASCSSGFEKNFSEEVVMDLYQKAESADVKYNGEPIPGEARPFPANFSLAGKVVLIDKPAFEGFPPEIPFYAYGKHSFYDCSWHTENPEDVRYVVLIEQFITPDGPVITDNSIQFTIVDLSYEEQVYKSIILGDPEEDIFPYDVLGEILEDLVL
jgi:hypothetical protein